MTAKRKGLITFLSVMLVLVISAGLTFAYLTGNAGEKTNVFSFTDNIRGQLDEPNWDPDEDGKDLVPGMEIWKDPMITNTSADDIDEWAAIKVTFKDGTGNALTAEKANKLYGLIDIDWNTTDWTLVGAYNDSKTFVKADGSNDATLKAMNNQVWVYNQKIAPAEITDPLFNSVKIHDTMSDEDMSWLSGVSLDHTPDCYTFGTCNCTPTYKHHVNCAVYGDDDAASVGKGGTSASSHTCDCTPAVQHKADCPALVGTLNPGCGHTVTDTIDGFQITNAGAILQGDLFEDVDATVDAFSSLFDKLANA